MSEDDTEFVKNLSADNFFDEMRRVSVPLSRTPLTTDEKQVLLSTVRDIPDTYFDNPSLVNYLLGELLDSGAISYPDGATTRSFNTIARILFIPFLSHGFMFDHIVAGLELRRVILSPSELKTISSNLKAAER